MTKPVTPARRKTSMKKAPVKQALRKPLAKKARVKNTPVKKAIVKKAAAKKSATKKPVAKSSVTKTSPKKSVLTKSQKQAAAAKREAIALARQKTITATTHHVKDGPVVTDGDDEAAIALVAKRRVLPKEPPSRKRTATDRAADPPRATGIALIERVTRAIERELTQIELVVGGSHIAAGQRTEAERRARTLASLARTLTEVRRLRAEENLQRPRDDADAPRDLDDFRRKLWARLESTGGAGTDTPHPGDERG